MVRAIEKGFWGGKKFLKTWFFGGEKLMGFKKGAA